MNEISRRDFLKSTGAAGLALTLAGSGLRLARAADASRPIRVGIVGTGGRGTSFLPILTSMDDVQVVALCDINPQNLANAQAYTVSVGRPKPEGYSNGEDAYKELMTRDDIDAVLIATPWECHTPMAVFAMEHGKYAGIEVPCSLTVKECWQLVKTSEKTGVPCMMLENWSFRRDNLAVLNMIRAGLFGQIVHCHCAHSHDCIDHWFFDRETGADRWPAKYLVEKNCDQYPTHSVGPVFSWMDINCGDTFDTLTSTATGSFGINDYFTDRFGPDHPGAKRQYKQGDIVTTVIKTKKNKTIVVNYDMQLPRPYDNRWMIQGTRGLYNETNASVYVQKHRGKDYKVGEHPWEPFEPYQQQFEHAWSKQAAKGFEAAHDGTDWLELRGFLDAARDKTQTPIDVYDSVLMSVLVPLSGDSIAKGSEPVKVPDFTNGAWETRKPSFAIDERFPAIKA